MTEDTQKVTQYDWLAMAAGDEACMFEPRPEYNEMHEGFDVDILGDASCLVENPPSWLKPRQLWKRTTEIRIVNGLRENNFKEPGEEEWNGYCWKLVEDHSSENQADTAPHCPECEKLEGEISTCPVTDKQGELIGELRNIAAMSGLRGCCYKEFCIHKQAEAAIDRIDSLEAHVKAQADTARGHLSADASRGEVESLKQKLYHLEAFACSVCMHQDSSHSLNCIECCPVLHFDSRDVFGKFKFSVFKHLPKRMGFTPELTAPLRPAASQGEEA